LLFKDKGLLVALCVLLFSGCASSYNSDSRVVLKNQDFLVVDTGASGSYELLAQRYLGSASFAYVIEDANRGIGKSGAEGLVSIPLKPLNIASVYSNGYQTIPILCYHQFVEGGASKSAMQVSSITFEKQMAYLAANGYHVIPFSRLTGFLDGSQSVPPNSVVISIDDGYRSVYQTAFPILKKYNYPATLFLYTDFVGGGAALNWSQIKEMQNSGLINIESHSRTHSSLVRKQSESFSAYQSRVSDEIVTPEKVIQRRMNKNLKHYAYPFGDTSALVVKNLEDRSYQLAATVQRGSNAAFAAPLLLKRNMIYAGDDMRAFIKQLKVFNVVNLK